MNDRHDDDTTSPGALTRPINHTVQPTGARRIVLDPVQMAARAFDRAAENIDLARVAALNGVTEVADELKVEAEQDLAEAGHWLAFL